MIYNIDIYFKKFYYFNNNFLFLLILIITKGILYILHVFLILPRLFKMSYLMIFSFIALLNFPISLFFLLTGNFFEKLTHLKSKIVLFSISFKNFINFHLFHNFKIALINFIY
jgi:hypothetical protein